MLFAGVAMANTVDPQLFVGPPGTNAPPGGDPKFTNAGLITTTSGGSPPPPPPPPPVNIPEPAALPVAGIVLGALVARWRTGKGA